MRPGEEGFVQLGLEGRLVAAGKDRVHGPLYDLGAHPGLRLDEVGKVSGLLLRIKDASVLPTLDAYEDYDPAAPERSLYIRREVTTLDQRLRAWVYDYRGPVPPGSLIHSGEWTKVLP